MYLATFSAALCRGLIEAATARASAPTSRMCFPRLYAAASLKPGVYGAGGAGTGRFPRLYAAASLKPAAVVVELRGHVGFPRLYAAASLKPQQYV